MLIQVVNLAQNQFIKNLLVCLSHFLFSVLLSQIQRKRPLALSHFISMLSVESKSTRSCVCVCVCVCAQQSQSEVIFSDLALCRLAVEGVTLLPPPPTKWGDMDSLY